MGVDFFCSDYPHLVLEAFKKFENQDSLFQNDMMITSGPEAEINQFY